VLSIYKILKFIFRHLVPGPLRYPVARAIARGVCFVNRSRRQILIENLIPIVGANKAPDIAPVLLGNFSMTAVDFFCSRRNIAAKTKEENWSSVEKTLKRTKKVMFVTAHIGHWELGISYLVEKGFAVSGVYAPYRADDVVRWIMDHRSPDVEWIPSTRGAMEACVHALEGGRLLGMVADIPFGEKGNRVRICNTWARLPLGPWAIASRARATVIPSFILREKPGQYRVVFHEPILPREGSFRRQMKDMQDIYRGHLERYLQKYPEQWGVLQPFWDR
jgi:lauroyl/myristoyl acyltransferase